MKKNKNIKTNDSIPVISKGDRVDNMGIMHDTPHKRHLMQEGENIDEAELGKTMFFMEVVAIFCLLIAISSTAGAFMKSSPDQYVQYPDGTIQKIEKQ